MNAMLEEKLRSFLNLYWLRPENGLLLFYKSEAFSDMPFASPSLDISCGDGVFMFLHQGGKFQENVDVFQGTKARQFSHRKFVDIYDNITENYDIKIERNAKIQIDIGTDWKQSLLDKASQLGLYNKLMLHDNNIMPFKLGSSYFNTIYSNSVYWISDVQPLINDCHRMLAPNGMAIFEVLTPYMWETFAKLEKYLSPQAINILDRNRRQTMPGLKSYKDWKSIFEAAGFIVEGAKNVFPEPFLIDFWNVGLRPLSHLLIQMAENLNVADRLRIKREWVDTLFELFMPLLSIKATSDPARAPYINFALKKKL